MVTPSSTPLPSARQTYALRLRASAHDPTECRGELEHVLSGDCESFESLAGLLAALARLQGRVMPVAGSAEEADPDQRRGRGWSAV